MSTSYPTDLDTLTNPTATDKVSVVSHSAQHANANDAIEALEAKVGKNSSGVTTSHDYKLSGVTGADKAVSLAGGDTLTNKTLTSPVLTTPKITTSINDANGNEVIKTPATASAVNEVEITNAATGNDPLIAPSGGDTDVGLKLKGKGTGKVKIGDAELQMPDVDGNAGELLTTNGSKVLSWVGATAVLNASETVAGLVEEATDAQVTAGTAAGETGAKLFVTPAKLTTNLAAKTSIGDIVKTVTVSLTSANIKAMYATPVEVIAAPGAGKAIVIENCIGALTYVAPAYGGGTGVYLVEETSGKILTGNIMDGSASSMNASADAYGLGTSLTTVVPIMTNKSVKITNATGAYTTGNGTMKLYIKYRIVTL